MKEKINVVHQVLKLEKENKTVTTLNAHGKWKTHDKKHKPVYAPVIRKVFNLPNASHQDKTLKHKIKQVKTWVSDYKEGRLTDLSLRRRRVRGAGCKVLLPDIRDTLFQFFIDVRGCLKGRLPKEVFIAKAKSLYKTYKENAPEGENIPTMKLSNKWFQKWCSDYGVSMRKPNKRFVISSEKRKGRILFLRINE